jgi:hypothetical protein
MKDGEHGVKRWVLDSTGEGINSNGSVLGCYQCTLFIWVESSMIKNATLRFR